jgi:hypothetical protein
LAGEAAMLVSRASAARPGTQGDTARYLPAAMFVSLWVPARARLLVHT